MDRAPSSATEQTNTSPAHVVVRGNAGGFLQEVLSGKHHLRADEPESYGGGDAAPGPYDYLLIGLGVCTCETKDGMLDRIDVARAVKDSWQSFPFGGRLSRPISPLRPAHACLFAQL